MSSRPAAAAHSEQLVLERYFGVPPERVWHAWTQGAALSRWFGPDGTEVAVVEIDLEVGGRYRVVMRAADGEEHEVSGVYREIVPPFRLVFTWAWRSTPERESLVTVTLAAAGTGTALTLIHERFADRPAADRHAEGWASSLGRLVRTFA